MTRSRTIPFARTRRVAFFGLVTGTVGWAGWMMTRIVAVGGITLLEAGILALFVPTFAWIALSFWTAVTGFVLQVLRRDPLTLATLPPDPEAAPVSPSGSVSRTALVVPIYDEDPDAVAARLTAMLQSLLRSGRAGEFDLHILSDTRTAAVAEREVELFERLRADHPSAVIRYRRRPHNDGRKAGNVGEFARRCRDRYDYMVTVDADSLMTGTTLTRLVDTMDRDPELGLVQTLPLPARQRTLFGRLIQFAAALYGPFFANGLCFWQGDAGNYWGHNAILRLKPFADHGRLPVLPGRAPLGGQILSHDFVEAAFLRRAGWKVILDPTPQGSWEEVPGNVPEFATRDRRWAQGSLQHLRLLREPGLHPLSRMHFLLGAMGYVSSLLWLLILVAGTAYVLLPWHGPTADVTLPPVRGSLLVGTAIVLFLPKGLGLILGLLRRRDGFGGGLRLTASVVLETAFSILLAPLMMLYHARFVTAILAGRSVEWEASDREAAELSWGAAVRAGRGATLIGAVWGGATLALSPAFFLWMGPIFAGLLSAIPLLRWTSSPALGRWTRRMGLLGVPWEWSPPPEIAAVDAVSTTPDPGMDSGVLVSPGTPGAIPARHAEHSMYNAERGLFELRQGRPLLIAPDRGSGGRSEDTLLRAVEALDAGALKAFRRLAPGPLRLVLTSHRVAAMGLTNGDGSSHAAYALRLDDDVDADTILRLASGRRPTFMGAAWQMEPARDEECAGLDLFRLGRLLPALLSLAVEPEPGPVLADALERQVVLRAGREEIVAYANSAGNEVIRLSEAPVPLAEAEDSTFILFREASGLHEHVAILVGTPEDWPDPVPVRLHSACLTGDLFGSLRCDCGDQLRGSMKHFAARGGGILLYLAQEGRGIGLQNKFRAYTLQEGGLDTIEADGTLGFGADERRYDVAVRILERIGVRRIELLTNNPEKLKAMEDAGIQVVVRRPLHGNLNRHNLPYVRAKVQRAGHWLGDMLSQPLSGD